MKTIREQAEHLYKETRTLKNQRDELLNTNSKLIDKIDEIQEKMIRVTMESQANAEYYLATISELEDKLKSK